MAKQANFHDTPDLKALIEATEWLDRINGGKLLPEEEAEFRSWLEADPAHQTEFNLLKAVWDITDIGNRESSPAAQKASGFKVVAPDAQLPGRLWGVFRGVHRRMLAVGSLAAVAAVLLIVAALWYYNADGPAHDLYRTATGLQQTVYLPDKTTVCLDSDTEIRTYYSEKMRRIELKKGRALFSVVHDPLRPFVVEAGGVNVLAVGTKFNVYKQKESKVLVAVAEGRVHVSKSGALVSDPEKLIQMIENQKHETPIQAEQQLNISSRPSGTLIDAGQEIVVDQKKSNCLLRPVETELVAEWRNGRLIFRDTPLEEVIDEINRYLENKIVIGDYRLKQLPVSIIFQIRDREFFLSAIEKALPITSKRTFDNQTVILYREAG